MHSIRSTAAYRMISEFYGDRRSERSKVLLMNHINEGIAVLDDICASMDAIEAFCIHPMLQADEDLEQNLSYVSRHVSAYVVALALEYRSVANEYLSHKVGSMTNIRLSPLAEVNDMLIADKVQNSKDFYLYHYDTHGRAEELDQYFRVWLEVLLLVDLLKSFF